MRDKLLQVAECAGLPAGIDWIKNGTTYYPRDYSFEVEYKMSFQFEISYPIEKIIYQKWCDQPFITRIKNAI